MRPLHSGRPLCCRHRLATALLYWQEWRLGFSPGFGLLGLQGLGDLVRRLLLLLLLPPLLPLSIATTAAFTTTARCNYLVFRVESRKASHGRVRAVLFNSSHVWMSVCCTTAELGSSQCLEIQKKVDIGVSDLSRLR